MAAQPPPPPPPPPAAALDAAPAAALAASLATAVNSEEAAEAVTDAATDAVAMYRVVVPVGPLMRTSRAAAPGWLSFAYSYGSNSGMTFAMVVKRSCRLVGGG